MLTLEERDELRELIKEDADIFIGADVAYPVTLRFMQEVVETFDAQQARIAELEKDAARYRWLRNPNQRIDSVIDKRVGELSSGMGIWEYKSGEELDAAIDAAMQPTWPEDASDYGSRIAVIGQNGATGEHYE